MARLHQAAAAGDFDKVQAYLNEGDDPNDMSEVLNSYGMKPVPGDSRHGGWGRNVTPLHLAAYNGHTSIVRLLVAADAD